MQREILLSIEMSEPSRLEGRLLAAVGSRGLGEDSLRWASRAFRGGSFSIDAVLEVASGRQAIGTQTAAINELRRHGFLWLDRREDRYLLRFPLPLRHELLPGLFDTPGDGITDLESNVLESNSPNFNATSDR